MKRQANGVNFDEGLALQTREELDLLFVDARLEELARLVKWADNESREPLLLGGQIGVGKSTLLNALMVGEGRKPDLLVAFDREAPAMSPGGFWGYALARLVQTASARGVSIPGGFAPADFPDVSVADWPALCRVLTTPPSSVPEADILRRVHDRIAEHSDLAERQCRALIEALQQQAGRALRLVCEGVDKFPPGSAGIESLTPVLNLLGEFKTLFEVNAVHLFGRNLAWQRAPQVFIPPLGTSQIQELLSKRLGLYEAGRRDVLPAIAGFSGGNPRQALRLLMAYDYERGGNRRPVAEALARACNRIRNDYLYLAFEAIPSDVLLAVEHDEFIRAGIVEGVGLMTPAAQAIYRDWVVLQSEPEEGDRWPARLNPLVQRAQLVANTLPESPETAAIRKWAERHGVNPYGLDFDTSCKSSVEVMNEVASSSSSMDVLNIVDLLDAIAASLFVTSRQDRILIAYRSAEVMATARDYLMGKANEMGFFPPKLIDLSAVAPDAAANILLAQLADERVICSVTLPRAPDKRLLADLDRRRDDFNAFEMLWWVHVDDLPLCLQHWPQLRQLMSVYRLEDELLGSLSPEEIQGDLDYLALLEKDDAIREAESSLRRVLNVVRESRAP
ncbi:MAG: hypothetical protein FJ387_06820 [Verrucomicrobia bacterium]|nr:hypothetical protein [Verrucomicrobiota bacterium]